jgi:hypothetical protein
VTWFPRYHDVPDRYIKDRIRDGLRVSAHVWKADARAPVARDFRPVDQTAEVERPAYRHRRLHAYQRAAYLRHRRLCVPVELLGEYLPFLADAAIHGR